MTRKDYVLIAEALKAVRPDANASPEVMDQWRLTAAWLANNFERDNRRFKIEKFKAAAGLWM